MFIIFNFMGFPQGPDNLHANSQDISSSQEMMQIPQDVELLPPGSLPGTFPQIEQNNLQVHQKQPLIFGGQRNGFSKPLAGSQTHSSLLQPFNQQTQNSFEPFDVSQGK